MILYTPDAYETHDPFGLFDKVVHINQAKDIREGGVLILWGGADIGTSLYGEKPNSQCSGFKPSARDIREIDYLKRAIELDIPIIGICRGAQLMCVRAGGKLMQHIDGHGYRHPVTLHDEGDAVIMCNSSHHQMMMPPKGAVVLASSAETSAITENDVTLMVPRVNEVVYFPTLNGLGIQPHPEWDDCPTNFVDYCVRKIKEYLL